MTERPVLETIRALLRFKDHTTIAEIAKIGGLRARHVLDVVNRNGEFVHRVRKNGKITKVDVQSPLRDELWKSGAFYRPDTYGAWSVEGHCLKFEGHPEIREALQQGRWVGAICDNYEVKVIIDTPENRAALEVAGLRPWDEAVIDDRLWIEEPV
ncbi:hypothetical protein [Bosea sp. ASV33]|uniref:hypothetical protein n=1 Tax=Bosea sp. ASV33 TaxID=2795106 RepID=UPI0018EE3BE5|nr:hypothetical protein [Bosea sp. ASV33]